MDYCYYDIKTGKMLGATSGYIGIQPQPFSGTKETMEKIGVYATRMGYDISQIPLISCDHIVLKKHRVCFKRFASFEAFVEYMKD